MGSDKERKRPFPVSVFRESKWFVARCACPAVTSQGRTRDEAVRNVREAINLYIESFGIPEET